MGGNAYATKAMIQQLAGLQHRRRVRKRARRLSTISGDQQEPVDTSVRQHRKRAVQFVSTGNAPNGQVRHRRQPGLAQARTSGRRLLPVRRRQTRQIYLGAGRKIRSPINGCVGLRSGHRRLQRRFQRRIGRERTSPRLRLRVQPRQGVGHEGVGRMPQHHRRPASLCRVNRHDRGPSRGRLHGYSD